MAKRELPLVVISDTHLGTYGCRAEELYRYLKSIKPETLVLNGDIIDIWQFRKRYFPKAHLKVLKQIISMASKGTKVYYLTGNHDEALRRFSDFTLGNITLADKLILDLPDGKAWIFHGDIFDASIQNAKWLAKLGGWGYDLLIMINSLLNWALEKMGRERYSLSKKIKNSVKKAVTYIQSFEDTAAELAIDQGYKYVICGHIHQPQQREIKSEKGSCTYLNSGDWIENLCALEFNGEAWELYQYDTKPPLTVESEDEELNDLDLQRIIQKVTFDERTLAS
ncbi:UDP-2,3-diacylglucosamine diphosphatase [Croceimicrobium hydrocarbonivorans]|uniref:UDP-2,3-diacylglucosamine diphosphatase n=1 Tax=Croceimicrobium hydrocarbonivorans TaxID=2761580 RepID=A0A7H0VEJ0_9FLAO|nr:UDP-2,3-diacylglucosamine diphosphatase [Croceimicrobium hydrocarbonivorans]QNR24138.1 UDP-2,3-diacylglucosamine diphosphatase [Croceimicrobium hydrocarbonivorans]|tara:strand:- start:26 stop:868 length:843 start_codon:yes stop_codon:yes gene_type:complete